MENDAPYLLATRTWNEGNCRFCDDEIYEMKDDVIKCSGPPAPDDHPLVYLKLDNGRVICPYCNELYEEVADDSTT